MRCGRSNRWATTYSSDVGELLDAVQVGGNSWIVPRAEGFIERLAADTRIGPQIRRDENRMMLSRVESCKSLFRSLE